jgi:hypothetical protein
VRLLIDSAITAFQLENMGLDNQNYATRLYEVGKINRLYEVGDTNRLYEVGLIKRFYEEGNIKRFYEVRTYQ